MLVLLEEYAVLTKYGIVILVMVGVYQLWYNIRQTKRIFQDSLSKEYREIIRVVPYNALVGKDLTEEEKVKAHNEIYNYMDFCNEQIYLRKNKRVDKGTWLNWQSGMKSNFRLSIFQEVSEEIFEKLPTIFNELKKLIEDDFDTDPATWERVKDK